MQKNKIDGPVLVTNASGYIEGWIIHDLLKLGFTVRAILPNFSKGKEIASLRQLEMDLDGKLELYIVDPLLPDAYSHILEGCKVVFQSIPQFPIYYNDDYADIIQPELASTRLLIHQVNRSTTVKKIIFTSSIETIFSGAKDLSRHNINVETEELWNDRVKYNNNPRTYSLTMCEKEAWRMYNNQNRWELIVLNPAIPMGPSITSSIQTKAVTIVKELLSMESSSKVPSIHVPLVDVRDVAKAHLKAAFLESANGRNIISAKELSIKEIATIIKATGKSETVPTGEISNLFTPFISSWGGFSKEDIKRNSGYPIQIKSQRAKKNLCMEYRPIEKSIEEFLSVIE